MKKAIMVTSLATMLSATCVKADTLLGLYIGGQIWANQAEGSFGDSETNQLAFNFDDKNQKSYFVALEHPIPFIPNIKIATTTLDTVGGATIDPGFSFTFAGETYSEIPQLDTTFDANYVDYTFYYELLDNDLLTFDVGITARDIETQIIVLESSLLQTSVLSASGILPMLYVNTVIGLPFTGLSLFAEGNFSSYDDSSVYDYQLGVSYAVLKNIAVDLDVTVGYRSVKLDLNDIDDLYSDITFDGIFAGATVHF